ncbi:MAG: branched-chain-amino-acid transaminase [Planctomycetia bacterium]|nr:branched-chain-amino-acid transaminase [Planctomycetia bacterium]
MTSATVSSPGTPGHARTRKIWMDGALVDPSEARVSVYDHGLLYGDGVFEGLRAYAGRVFKLDSHLKRLEASAASIRLRIPYSRAELAQAVRDTVAACGMPDCYIRLVVTRGVGSLGLNPFSCPRPGVVVIADTIQLYPPELYRTGMKVIVAKRPRIPVECLDPAIKSLNYLNNILAKCEAIDAGVLEAIMLNLDGEVSECTGDNIFAITGTRISTPPTSAGILHGITRQFVIDELAPALGMLVEVRRMRLEDLYSADEVFLTGTAAEIIGVSAIGDRTIGSGQMGPVSKRLEAEFRRRITAGAPED